MNEHHHQRQPLSRQERFALKEQLSGLEKELAFWRQQSASPFSRRKQKELEARRQSIRHRLSDTRDAA